MVDLKEYQFFQELCQLDFIDKIYLYGSRARGDNQIKSDFDLAVDCPNASKSDWHTVIGIIDNADTLIKIDCIRLDQLPENKLKENVMAEGLLIYNRNSNV